MILFSVIMFWKIQIVFPTATPRRTLAADHFWDEIQMMDSSNYFLRTNFFLSVSSQKAAILFTAICLRGAINLTKVCREHTLGRVVEYFPVITLVLSHWNWAKLLRSLPQFLWVFQIDMTQLVQRTLLMMECVVHDFLPKLRITLEEHAAPRSSFQKQPGLVNQPVPTEMPCALPCEKDSGCLQRKGLLWGSVLVERRREGVGKYTEIFWET